MKTVDLHELITNLTSETPEKRAVELLSTFADGASLCAFGGVPVQDTEQVRRGIEQGLGLSGVMTYMNKSRKSLEDLSSLCVKHGHLWGYRWMTLSILLCGYGPEAELAMARDGNFQLSWPVDTSPGIAFVANGTIREWLRFTKRMYDKSFHADARTLMRDAAEILWQVLPQDREQHFLQDLSHHAEIFKRISLTGRNVLEIGAGRGELTSLILEQNPDGVLSYEIEPGLCKIQDTRLILHEDDIRLCPPYPNDWGNPCLISNPPYSLLPFIKHEIIDTNKLKDVLLMIPPKQYGLFEGYEVVARIDGSSFSPKSKGEHWLIMKGFDQ